VTGGERPDPGDFTVGSVVAGYRLEEQIGQGGMAVVYRARDVQLGRNVALKLLSPVLALDNAFRQRFIRESRAAAAVDHPYIIPIFAAGESDGVLFIAMRYVQGGDVRTLLDNQGPLPPDRAAGIITQVALALDAAHLHGLVHRDIKPANMLLDPVSGGDQRDHVYLADFGLSKRSLSVTGLTSIGQFVGTPAYVAPEQVEGRPVDSRADQYALACAAFEILSGVPPYERDDDLAIMWAHVSAPPPSLAGARPGLPEAVDAVIAQAMAKSPADRFPTCIAFAMALRQALGAQIHPHDLAAARSAPPTADPGMPAGAAGEAAPGDAAERPPPRPHPATEISWPRGSQGADPAAAAGRGPAGPADGEFPPTMDWEAAPPAGPVPQDFGQPAEPGPPGRPEPPAPAGYGPPAAAPGDGPAAPQEPPPEAYEPPPAAYEPPTEDGWLPPLRGGGWVAARSGTAGGGRGAPPWPESRGGATPPGAPPSGTDTPSRQPPPGGARKRSFWWPRGAVIIGCAAAAGIAIGAVIGLTGGDAAPTAGAPGTAGQAGAPLAVPGCRTAVAAARTLTGVRSARAGAGNQPFGVVTTADGAFSFVTAANSVSVLSNGPAHGGGLAPTLIHVLPAPGANGSLQLTHDGRYLLVAANSGAIVMNVANAEAGAAATVGELTSPFGSGAVEVAISADDRFAFITLENSAALVVFNLQNALASGFGPGDVVGEIPLSPQPIGMAISPDGRWLYATSRMRTSTAAASEGTISVIDLARAETAPSSAAIVSTVTAGCSPVRIITSPDGSEVWVTSRESNALLGFSAAAMRSKPAQALIARADVGAAPIGLAMVKNGSRILVANSNLNGPSSAATSISVISTSAALARGNALLGQISTGLLPREFSVAPDGKTALVTNNGSGQVQAIDLGTLPLPRQGGPAGKKGRKQRRPGRSRLTAAGRAAAGPAPGRDCPR